MSKEEKRIAREKVTDKASTAAGGFLQGVAAFSLMLAVTLPALGVVVGIIMSCLEALGVTQVGWFWATFPFWAPWAGSLAFALLFCMASFGVECLA